MYHGPPVVGHVVQYRGGCRRRVVPRPHGGTLGISQGGHGIDRFGHQVEGPGQRRTPSRLDGDQRGPAFQAAQGHRVVQGLGCAAGQRTAPHLDEQAVGRWFGSRPGGGQLEAQGPATVQGQEVVGPLAPEGEGSLGDQLPEPQDARVAGLAATALTGPDVGS